MKNISILGSTGSIGTQALDVIRNNRDEFRVVGLSTNKNIDLLYEQINEFKPLYVAAMDDTSCDLLKAKLIGKNIQVYSGIDGLSKIAESNETDILLTAVVGMVGLIPTLKAIEKEKTIALANKETLVSGGYVINEALKRHNSTIIPVDSEHCAIHQCLSCSEDYNGLDVNKLIITASGGPFRGKKKDELLNVTPEMALKHPNWNMGKKISIDSATLMNKGLEVIEAHWLFNMDFDKIDVIVHPQSIIHSMVEYIDGAIIAQLGVADMRTPILYALSYPKRLKTNIEHLDLLKNRNLTFEEPDIETFRCLHLAYEAGKVGGTMPSVLNAANEACVDLFLKGIIKFTEIPYIIEDTMMKHKNVLYPNLDDIIEADKQTRQQVYKGLRW